MSYHVATVNIAIARYQYDDPRFAGFVDNLDRINAIADGSNGFVWRYISDDDDATRLRLFGKSGRVEHGDGHGSGIGAWLQAVEHGCEIL